MVVAIFSVRFALHTSAGLFAQESGRSRNATVAPTAAFAYVNNRSPVYCHVVTAMYFVMYICVVNPLDLAQQADPTLTMVCRGLKASIGGATQTLNNNPACSEPSAVRPCTPEIGDLGKIYRCESSLIVISRRASSPSRSRKLAPR